MKSLKYVCLFLVGALSLNSVCAQTIREYLLVWQNKKLSDSVRFFALDEVAWYYAHNRPDSGYTMANLQLKFIEEKNIKTPGWITRAYNNRSWSYASGGNAAQAIEDQFKVLEVSEKAGYTKGIATAQGNLGHFYHNIRQSDNALKYQQAAIETNKALKDEAGLARAYNNIALVYDALHDNKNALKYLRLSFEIKNRQKDQESMIILYNNFANQYSQLNRLDSAIYFAKTALELTASFPNDVQKALSNANLSAYYIKLRQYEKAYAHAHDAYDLTVKLQRRQDRKHVLKLLATSLEWLGRQTEALGFYKEYVSLNDSLMNEEGEMKAIKTSLKYELRKKLEADSLENIRKTELRDLENRQMLARQKFYTYSAMGGSVLVLAIAFVSFRAYRQKKKDHIKITEQKKIVESKQAEIVDSINYARHIQHAILAGPGQIKKVFPASFLLYEPKDIVAGDFYFFETTATHIFYAAADCTGHGVPGALVSMVCSNALTRCVREFGLTDPGNILDHARQQVIETFEKSGQAVKDGMDISLISVSLNDLNRFYESPGPVSIRWAGANNPLWIIRNNAAQVEVVKPDKQPIGRHTLSKPFTTHTITMEKGDSFYLFTDGYADQFGGAGGKKFKYSALQELLLGIYTLTPSEQEKVLREKFRQWSTGFEQTDDVCITGVRL